MSRSGLCITAPNEGCKAAPEGNRRGVSAEPVRRGPRSHCKWLLQHAVVVEGLAMDLN